MNYKRWLFSSNLKTRDLAPRGTEVSVQSWRQKYLNSKAAREEVLFPNMGERISLSIIRLSADRARPSALWRTIFYSCLQSINLHTKSHPKRQKHLKLCLTKCLHTVSPRIDYHNTKLHFLANNHHFLGLFQTSTNRTWWCKPCKFLLLERLK